MTERTLAAVPDAGVVWAEQLRTTALGVKRELIGAAIILGVPTLLAAVWQARHGGALTLDPSEGYGWVLAVAAVLFPLAVWKDEARFGDSQLWMLPFDRRRHALLKVGAGWALLMAFVAAAMVFLVGITLVTGGTLGDQETRLVLLNAGSPAWDVIDNPMPAGALAAEAVEWTTAWWQWLVPFTAATVAYLIGSALILATPRPWWWVGGAFLLVMTFGVLSEELDIANDLFELIVFGPIFLPLGLDTVMTSGWDSLTTAFQRPDGSWAQAWRSLPTGGEWLTATGIWGGLGAVGLWAASLRHRDG